MGNNHLEGRCRKKMINCGRESPRGKRILQLLLVKGGKNLKTNRNKNTEFLFLFFSNVHHIHLYIGLVTSVSS